MLAPIFLALAYIPFVLSEASTTLVTSLVTTTLSPGITPTAVSEAFIGYSTEPALGAYTAYYCPPGQIWTQIGNYGRCCDNDPYKECGVATACFNTSLMIGPSSQQIWTCAGTGTQTLCVTGTVYQSIGVTQGAVTNCQCWPSWAGGNWDATRNVATTTSSSSISSSSSSQANTTSTTPSSVTPATSTESSTPQTSPTPTAKKGLQTGAIIGIAISISILVALAILAILYKRRKYIPSSRGSEIETPGHAPGHAPEPETEYVLKAELSGQSLGMAPTMERNIDSEISPIGIGSRGEIVRHSDDSGSYRTPAGSIERRSTLVERER